MAWSSRRASPEAAMRITDLLLCAALAAPAGALAHAEKHAVPKVDYSKAEEMPFGKASDPAKAARTIRVDMADTMRFIPSEITLKRGESVRFVATNRGKVMHEMVLGTMKELRARAARRRQPPATEHRAPHM